MTLSERDQIKLYVIEQILQEFGDDAMSRIVPSHEGFDTFFYTYDAKRRERPEPRIARVLDENIFDDGSVLSDVVARFERVTNHGTVDEQMYQFRLTGETSDILANIRDNDAQGLQRALDSKRAVAVLRKQKAMDKTHGKAQE